MSLALTGLDGLTYIDIHRHANLGIRSSALSASRMNAVRQRPSRRPKRRRGRRRSRQSV